jgi:TRAP-type C4-dicarboxylate transport system substrate-binding protein
MFTSRKLPSAAVTLAALVGLSACTGSGSPEAPSRAVDTSEAANTTLELTLGTDDTPERPSGQQIEHFAEAVTARSDGAIEIKPVWRAAGEGIPHWDQAVAELVMAGELDMALVPSRTWDALGVTSLTALNAPFLIDSDQLTDRVIQELADDLLSGLADAQVVGLGMFREGMRHPFGYESPLLSAEDYKGGVVRAPYSRTVEALLEALGARLSDEPEDPSVQRGSESSFALAHGGTVTGNVAFYPKVNTLVMNADARASLTDDQWAVLTAAAEDTRQWVAESFPTDVELAEKFCKDGGRMAMATAADRRSLVEATRPVTESLAQDSTTRGLLTRIEGLKKSVRPAPVKMCTPTAQGGSALNGVYTTRVPITALLDNDRVSEDSAYEQAGRYEVTLADGTWDMQQRYSAGPNRGELWTGSGSYTFENGRLRFLWSHSAGEWSEADVRIHDDGSLTFSEHEDGAGEEALEVSKYQFKHWKRVADAP